MSIKKIVDCSGKIDPELTELWREGLDESQWKKISEALVECADVAEQPSLRDAILREKSNPGWELFSKNWFRLAPLWAPALALICVMVIDSSSLRVKPVETRGQDSQREYLELAEIVDDFSPDLEGNSSLVDLDQLEFIDLIDLEGDEPTNFS